MMVMLALLLVFLPGGIGNDVYALPKAAFACAAVLMSFLLQRPATGFAETRAAWLFLAAALGISTLFSWDLGYSLVSVQHSRGLGLLQWAVCALLFLYGRNMHRDDVDRGALLGGLLMAMFAMLQYTRFTQRVDWGSTQGGPVVLGEMLAVCFPIALRVNPVAAGVFLGTAVIVQCRSAVLAMAVTGAYLSWKQLTRR